jgi:hypothetical protein
VIRITGSVTMSGPYRAGFVLCFGTPRALPWAGM